MGLGRLLRRRLLTHPVALVAVVVAVLVSMTAVATLQLLSAAISEASVRSTLSVPPAERSVVVTGTVRPGELATADALVRRELDRAAPGQAVTRVGRAPVRGIRGMAATDRAALVDLDGPDRVADLTEGRWPAAPGPGVGPGTSALEVALPVPAARELGVAVGGTLELDDLVTAGRPPLTVVVVGEFRPSDPAAPVWVDEPLSLVGHEAGDFTTFGAFVTAPGALDAGIGTGSTTTTWRLVPDLRGVGVGDVASVRDHLGRALVDAERTLGVGLSVAASQGELSGKLRDATLRSGVGGLLDRAGALAAQVRSALLTPTVLLVLLGTTALIVAAALLANLRESETRLLRTRGASSVQLAQAAAADALAVVVAGAAASIVLAPWLARRIGDATGLQLAGQTWLEAVRSPHLWVPVGIMAVLVLVVIVVTTVRVGAGRGGGAGAGRSSGTLLGILTGSGLDALLVALGVLAVVQLRRHPVASAATDPLTTAAPAFVIAGLAVLTLRALPLLMRAAARPAAAGAGFDRAWTGWQLARRLSGETGTIVLVLLAQAMGTLALTHAATVSRAVTDQATFEAGAPLRVQLGAARAGTDVGAQLVEAAGGADRAMPVHREVIDLGPFREVTVLALDTAVAGRVAAVRPDLVGDSTWARLMADLSAARDLGGAIPLDGMPRNLAVTARLDVRGAGPGEDAGPARLWLRDGAGLVHTLTVGQLQGTAVTHAVTVPEGLPGPLAVIGVTVQLSDELRKAVLAGQATAALAVDAITQDGVALVLDPFTDQSGAEHLVVAGPTGAAEPVPVVITRPVADSTTSTDGSTWTLDLLGRRVDVVVRGIVDQVPTARVPDRAVILDLPTVLSAADPTTPGVRSATVLGAREWWLAPADPAAAERALRPALPFGSSTVLRSDLVDQRLVNPVNAGMAAAMWLITAAGLLLAVVGFAASTTALGVARRHENAVLLALGVPPWRVRRDLAAERVVVVVLTVVTGVVVGLVAALAVVPRLVGADGRPQVPDVLVVLPWDRFAWLSGVVVLLLAVIGLAVAGSSGRELAAELRRGQT